MNNLSRDQRKVLAEFFGNFAITWIAAGIIAPYISKQDLFKSPESLIISLVWAVFSILAMLELTKGGK